MREDHLQRRGLMFWNDDVLKPAESHLESLDRLKKHLTHSDPCPILHIAHKRPSDSHQKSDMSFRKSGN